MKRILIICDPFTPPLYAPRIRFLSKHLKKLGWQPLVVTEKVPRNDFQTDDFELVEIPYYQENKSRFEWIWKQFANLFFDYKECYFRREVERRISVSDSDVILCSTFNLFPLLTANYLAQKYHKPLVADLRDIAEQWTDYSYFEHTIRPQWLHRCLASWITKKNIRKRNAVLKCANAVISVSPWHVQFLKRINPNTSLIFNGYDEKFVPLDTPNDLFEITYTGKLYDLALRNPYLLLRALSELLNDGLIDAKCVRLNWYIDQTSFEMMRQLTRQYGLESITRISGYVPSNDVVALLQRSSVVVVLTNKATEKGPHGIMTTKFFEALGVEKPVLCVRSDEECLAEVIKQTNAGLAATTVEQVKQFILEKQAEWQKNGFTRQNVNLAEKAKFSRQTQAKQFVQIFEKLTAK
ncbi:MAG TPA: glycosyltransferase [Paludibacteraceae bacterium]|nr:glycosyltransferase [Paludibacteraceae bacterium]HOS37773.1 glycosyltransferase [Paludibacteraceae bacterium]HPK21035.1 glycosyltransferase [Paludibacteraceae bacterium]HRR58978.1 glycosyltransferase [Paludibacteraceae bacterium]HRU72812.1 glycosyltransferase [Paludibacteraceae bacterium]